MDLDCYSHEYGLSSLNSQYLKHIFDVEFIEMIY